MSENVTTDLATAIVFLLLREARELRRQARDASGASAGLLLADAGYAIQLADELEAKYCPDD